LVSKKKKKESATDEGNLEEKGESKAMKNRAYFLLRGIPKEQRPLLGSQLAVTPLSKRKERHRGAWGAKRRWGGKEREREGKKGGLIYLN